MKETSPLISTSSKQLETSKSSTWLLGVGCIATLLFMGAVSFGQGTKDSHHESLELATSMDFQEDSGQAVNAMDMADSKDTNVLTYLSDISLSPNETSKPNVLFVYVDDMGYNDIGYTSTDLPYATPALDALASDGVKLTRYYTMSSCTPARASLLTGKYAANVGMGYDGDASFCIASLYGLSLNHRTIGEIFQESGYETHIVGKWNVGHYRETYWPHERGFDTFYGYNGDEERYYSHKAFKSGNFDLCDFAEANSSKSEANSTLVTGKTGIFIGDCHHGEYSTDLYADRIKTLIKSNAEEEDPSPFFIYFASQAVHAPLEAPPNKTESLTNKQVKMLKQIHRNNDYGDDGQRRELFALMLIHLDEKVRDIVDTMYKYGKLDNAVIVMASDNGGCPQYGASNWPLRGTKFSSFEGGIKVPALFWSSRIATTSRNRDYANLFHVTDWLPTLLDCAYLDAQLTSLRDELDGVSHWGAIAGYPIKTIPRVSALIHLNAWRKSTNNHTDRDYSKWHLNVAPFSESLSAIIHDDWKFIMNMRSQKQVSVYANYSEEVCKTGMDSDFGARYLFNITDDPYEEHNLAEIRPEITEELQRIIHIHYEKAIKSGANWRPCVTKTAFEVFKQYDYFVVPFEGNSTNIYG